jgi:hypothetical protein
MLVDWAVLATWQWYNSSRADEIYGQSGVWWVGKELEGRGEHIFRTTCHVQKRWTQDSEHGTQHYPWRVSIRVVKDKSDAELRVLLQ